MGSLLGYPRDFLVASLTTEKSANMDNSLLRCARLQQEGVELDVLAVCYCFASYNDVISCPQICLKELIGKIVENAFPENF